MVTDSPVTGPPFKVTVRLISLPLARNQFASSGVGWSGAQAMRIWFRRAGYVVYEVDGDSVRLRTVKWVAR